MSNVDAQIAESANSGATRTISPTTAIALSATVLAVSLLFGVTTRGSVTVNAPAASTPSAVQTTAPAAFAARTPDPAAAAAYCSVIASALAEPTPNVAVARGVYAELPTPLKEAPCVPAAVAALLGAERAESDRIATAATLDAGERNDVAKGLDAWNVAFADWVSPARGVALPAVALLVVLLVLARTATRAVPADTVGWDRGPVGVISALGILLMALSASWPTMLTSWGLPDRVRQGLPDRPLDDTGWLHDPTRWALPTLVNLVLVTLTAVSLGARPGRRSPATGSGRPIGYPSFAALIVLASGLVTAAAWDPPKAWLLPLGVVIIVAGIGVACLGRELAAVAVWTAALAPLSLTGLLDDAPVPRHWVEAAGFAAVGLVAYVSATARALRFEVLTDGSDADATRRCWQAQILDQAGSAPRGLRIPQGTDVDTLPTDALVGLPGNVFASTMLRLVRIAVPLVPWQFTLGLSDDGATVITKRNGQVVGVERITLTALLPPTAQTAAPTPAPVPVPALAPASGAAKDPDPKDVKATEPPDDRVIVAAAALVLVTLAERHRVLRRGLNGATVWRSVALQVIATSPTFTDPAERLRTLDRAVALDLNNRGAQVALLGERSLRAGTAPEWRQVAASAAEFRVRLLDGRSAEDALQAALTGDEIAPAVILRSLYLCLATTLNAELTKAGLPAAASSQVIAELNDLRPALDLATQHLTGEAHLARQLEVICAEIDPLVRAGAGFTPSSGPLTSGAAYARACTLLHQGPAAGSSARQAQALQLLKIAFVDPQLREFAPDDPFLKDVLQSREGVTLLRPPATSIAELQPFSAHADALAKLAVSAPGDLVWLMQPRRGGRRGALRNENDLRSTLGLSPLELRRWHDLSIIAAALDDALTVDAMALLIETGIRTRDHLATRLRRSRRLCRRPDALLTELNATASKTRRPQLTEEDLDRWRARLL